MEDQKKVSTLWVSRKLTDFLRGLSAEASLIETAPIPS